MRLGLAMVICAGSALCVAAPAWRRRRRRASSPRTRSTRAPGRPPSTRPATATPASIVGATWATGRYGGALSFDGTQRLRRPARPRHLLQQRLHARGLGAEGDDEERRRRSSARGPAAGRCSGSTTSRRRYHLTLGGSLSSYLDSGVNPIAGPVAAPRRHLRRQRPPASTSTASRSPAARVSGSVGSSNTWRIGAYGSVAGRLLRRPDRRDPRLRPRAQRGRDRRPT